MPRYVRICPACNDLSPEMAPRCEGCGSSLFGTKPVPEAAVARVAAPAAGAASPAQPQAYKNVAVIAEPHEPDDAGEQQIRGGILMLLIGAGVTAFSYYMAQGGGTYVVTTGLFVVGIVKLVRGFSQL